MVSDGCSLVCVSPGRDSPPANEASEEAEEPMAVPEDLSASSNHQQNNRGDKGTRQPDAPTASQNITDACAKLRINESEVCDCYVKSGASHEAAIKVSQNHCSAFPSSNVFIPKASKSK